RAHTLHRHLPRERARTLDRQPSRRVLGSELMLQTTQRTETATHPVTLTIRPVIAGSALAGNRLSRRTPWAVLVASLAASFALFALLAAASGGRFSVVGAVLVGAIGYLVVITVLSLSVEG